MLLLLKELRERTHKRWFFFGMQVLVIISSRHGDFWNCDQDTGKRTVGIKHDHAVVRCHTISGRDRFLRYLFTYLLITDFEARYQITICTSLAYSGEVWSDLRSPEFTIGIKLPRHITFALKGCT